MNTKVDHVPGCIGDEDEAVSSTVTSNAAAGTAFRSHQRYTCTMCGAQSPWRRIDPWRYKFPDKEESNEEGV